jgi:integrase
MIDLGWENGKRRRKSIYGRTQAEVNEERIRILRGRQQGIPIGDGRQTVKQYLDKWLESIKPPMVRPRTYERFEGIVRLYLVPALGHYRLAKLHQSHVQKMLNDKLVSREVAPRKSDSRAERPTGLSLQSVKHIRATLRLALNRAVKDDLLARNVAALTDLPKLYREPVRPLTPDDARKLLKAVASHRLEALYSVALACGIRRGEMLGLSWKDDVDLEAGKIRVNHSLQRVGRKLQLLPPKTAESRRTIDLPAFALRALTRHRARQLEERLAAGPAWKNSGLVFTTIAGGPLEPRNVLRQFKGLLKKAGLAPSRFHDLRHTAASLLLAQGEHPRVVMEILGHSRISLTMDTYSHVMPTLRKEAAARMEAILG